MVNVLDVLETPKNLSPAPTEKAAEPSKAQPEAEIKQTKVEAAIDQAETEAGPLVPAETRIAATEKSVAKEAKFLTPEALSEDPDYFIRHASGKRLSEG
jgi:transposase